MKLKFNNQLLSDNYTIGKKTVLTLSSVRIAKKEYPVIMRMLSAIKYNDQGNQYEVVSQHYFVKAKVFGRLIEFNLSKLDVPITVLKYSVKD